MTDAGLLSSDPADLRRRVISAWEIMVDVVDEVDLDRPGRSSRRTTREEIIAIGSWPDSRGVPELKHDAATGATETEPMRDAADRLAVSHADASDDQIRESVRRALVETAEWLEGPDFDDYAPLPVPSPLGVLPMGTVVHSAVFQLAVTARDLMPAGALPRPALDDLGLVALMDSTGAVGARIELTARASAVTQRVTVGTAIEPSRWQTVIGDQPAEGPAAVAPAEVLIDLAAGRIELGTITRSLRFRQTRGLLALSPVVDALPDLPAAPLLRQVARWARLFA